MTDGTPHRCPVCYGTGQVDASFYQPLPPGVVRQTTSGVPMQEQCRSCDGRGVVWQPAPLLLPPPTVTIYPPPNSTIGVPLPQPAGTWTYQHECAWPAGTFTP